MSRMPQTWGDMHRQALRVRFAAHPASVPAARRFVVDGLTAWGRESLVDDVSLCVTELSTNAALHSGSRFFEVEVHRLPESVQVAVVDGGASPAAAVSPRPAWPGGTDAARTLSEQPTTGRGLAIVSMLVTSWGVDETPAGKRVWAQVAHDGEHGVRPPVLADEPGPEATTTSQLPPDWYVVRLVDCPVGLALAHDRNVDELIRELQLIDSADSSPSHALVELIEELLSRHAASWQASRVITQDAAAAGRDLVDIEVAVPGLVVPDVRSLQQALRHADALCDRELMTLAAPPEVWTLRDWMAAEFVQQIEDGAEPIPYAGWLARHQGR